MGLMVQQDVMGEAYVEEGSAMRVKTRVNGAQGGVKEHNR